MIAIVDFFEEKSIEFVPKTWLGGVDAFYWPVNSVKLNAQQIKLKEDPLSTPSSDWILFKCNILKICGTVSKAREKLRKLEKDPDYNLSSSDQNRNINSRKRSQVSARQVKKKKHYQISNTSESDDLKSSSESEQCPSVPFISSERTLHNPLETSVQSSSINKDFIEPNSLGVYEIPSLTVLPNSTDTELIIGSIEELHRTFLTSFKQLNSTVEKLCTRVLSMEEDIRILLRNNYSGTANIKESLPTHPINSETELQLLEDFIREKENYDKLIAYLAQVGEGESKKVIYSILSRLFTNRFAERINFIGKNGKLEFKSSPILPLIKDAVAASQIYNTISKEKILVTEQEIESSIKSWFRTSKGRK